MSTYTYKSLVQLDDASNLSLSDVILISQYNDDDHTQLISRKTTLGNISSSIIQPLINQSLVGKYLPLSAGNTNNVTGTIYSSNPGAVLRYSNEHEPLRIIAGPYTSDRDDEWLPARLELYHNKYDSDDHNSSFAIHVSQLRGVAHTNYTTTLRGKPNGELTWDTKNIVRSVNNKEAVANGNVTIEITDISGLNASLNNKLNLTANANSASKLLSSRTITLSGDCTGSFSFDGSNDVSVNVLVNDNSHNHTLSNIDGLCSLLSNKIDITAKCDEITYTNEAALDRIPSNRAVNDWCKNVLISTEVQLSSAYESCDAYPTLARMKIHDISTDIVFNCPSYVISTYYDFDDSTDELEYWCRIYSDKWCEQGGTVLFPAGKENTQMTIELHRDLNYSSRAYSIQLMASVDGITSDIGHIINELHNQRTISSFAYVIHDVNGSDLPGKVCWETKGLLK